MIAKGLVQSSSVVEVFITDGPSLEQGTISLLLYNKQKESTSVLSIDYTISSLSFIFDISELTPSYVSHYDFSIEIRDVNGKVLASSKLKSSVGKVDSMITGVVKKVVHDFTLVAKNINGSKVVLFKKLSSGEKCKECWDDDLDSSSNSNCKTCGGTGKITRYSQPYTTYAGALQFSNDSLDHRQEGMISDYGPIVLSLPAMVKLATDDVLFYQILGIWLIVNTRVSIASLKRMDTLQTVAMSELPSHSPQVETILAYGSFKIENKWR